MAAVVWTGGSHRHPTTQSVHTQTSLTWPRGQNLPSQINCTSASYHTDNSEWIYTQAAANPGIVEEGTGPSSPILLALQRVDDLIDLRGKTRVPPDLHQWLLSCITVRNSISYQV